MRPATPGQSTQLFGFARFVWLAKLNDSARNCSLNALGDSEVLEERHIPLRERRSDERVSPDRAELSALRPLPWTADLTIRGQRRIRRFEPAELARIVDARIADHIRPAPTRVTIRIAIAIAGRERLARHPVICSVHLPSAENQIDGLRRAADMKLPVLVRPEVHRATTGRTRARDCYWRRPRASFASRG